ncbi:MAG: hypothetical protein QG653_427 [Patescibacteria group bacterium]|nr:hypothetical protein [Patescibacteria group bacterium]
MTSVLRTKKFSKSNSCGIFDRWAVMLIGFLFVVVTYVGLVLCFDNRTNK